MKKSLIIFLGACSLFCGQAMAGDVVLNSSGSKNWASLGILEGDNLLITATGAEYSFTNMLPSFELGYIKINAADPMRRTNFMMRTSDGKRADLKINGNLDIASETFFINGGNLEITGDVNITTPSTGKVSAFGYNSSGTLNKFTIGGNFSNSYNAEWSESTMIAAFSTERRTEAYNAAYWNDADINVGGAVSLQKHALKIYTSVNANAECTTNVYAKFGSLISTDSSTGISVMVSNQPVPPVKGVLNLMITGNGADYVDNTAFFAGGLSTNSKGGMHLFMNSGDGKLIQKINGNMNFYDGVTMMSGTLLLNFKDGNAGLNHGDLEMLGGKFGSCGTVGGAFRFNRIVYKSGTIALALQSATAFDNLTLVDTISFDQSAAASAKVTFDFGSNLAWLIDSAENGGKGIKVISWANKSSISDETGFAANIFEDKDGNKFAADFTSADDGLYVKYVAVPEPATVVALFGAFALAFAAWRRRK